MGSTDRPEDDLDGHELGSPLTRREEIALAAERLSAAPPMPLYERPEWGRLAPLGSIPPTAEATAMLDRLHEELALPDRPPEFLLPEDRGRATLSELGGVEYVTDLIRPGRIVVWAAEEGSGKSFAVLGELAIRLAVGAGSFAGTWPILQTGPVLVLSEMHPDDDFAREETVLESLGLSRAALAGLYFRLPLLAAAGRLPALMAEDWLDWIAAWLRQRNALALMVDTATAASLVDPWGKEIHVVFQNLRRVLEDVPALAIVLVVHLKKPSGRGPRRLSDVLGEWGRWNDVTVLQENDGRSLGRTRLTLRKRVQREMTVVATKSRGLLIDPVDLTDRGASTKVTLDAVLTAVVRSPGIGLRDLGIELDVSKDTAGNYVARLEADGRLRATSTGLRGAKRVFPVEATAEPPKTADHAQFDGSSADAVLEGGDNRRTAEPNL